MNILPELAATVSLCARYANKTQPVTLPEQPAGRPTVSEQAAWAAAYVAAATRLAELTPRSPGSPHCPKCGSPMAYSSATGVVKCHTCGDTTRFSAQQNKAALSAVLGTNSALSYPVRLPPPACPLEATLEWAMVSVVLRCPCGSEVILNEAADSKSCPCVRRYNYRLYLAGVEL